jgi:hypothetical protein
MILPRRIQRKRTKGWKMPPNTVSVTRPGKWGNPFYIINEEGAPWITDARDPSMPVLNYDVRELLGMPAEGPLLWSDARRAVVELFRQQCCDRSFADLRGKNLACWCLLTNEHGGKFYCHADIILERANA